MTQGFIDYMVHPLVSSLVRFLPEVSYFLQNLKENRKFWADVCLFDFHTITFNR